MRRTAKPFTIEVKKRGGHKREASDTPDAYAKPVPFPAEMVNDGRGMRFREAENLFRGIEQRAAAVEDASVELAVEQGESSGSHQSPRRILPDLIAEAALTEASREAMPAPRRRGRPPKSDASSTLPRPAKRRPVQSAPEDETGFLFADLPDPVQPPIAVPAVSYLAASARRRAARHTGNLPRAERWKRRLPKVCW